MSSEAEVIRLPLPEPGPEERPVLVVDFGGQYSQLISWRISPAPNDILLPCRAQSDVNPVVPRVGVAPNVANALTGVRMVLVPVFLVALFVGDGHETNWRIVAFAIFAVAVITDHIDGRIVRSYGMVTEFGKLADPIADKALIGAALIGLSLLGDLPWCVVIVILVREVAVTVLRFAVLRLATASRGGKLSYAGPGRGDRPFHHAAVGCAAGRGVGSRCGRRSF